MTGQDAGASSSGGPEAKRYGDRDAQRLLRLLAISTFFVFFQAFMVAPLIPRLAELFDSSIGTIGLAIPAYLVPYGIMTLVWGPLSDRLGRGPVILGSLVAFVVLTAATALAGGASVFVAARLATAIGASGVVPISLALVGDRFEFRNRGRALSWLFSAMAGGTAFGSSLGALLEPVIGWRGLFVAVAIGGAVVLALLWRERALLGDATGNRRTAAEVARGYVALLRDRKGLRTYAYVLANSMLHGGIYAWLGLYFERRFGLGSVGIGLALLGYGVPGFLVGSLIGRYVDKRGRARLIPIGVAVAAVCALGLALHVPLVVAALIVAVLSLGYDLTQPLLAGIVTQLPGPRGQAMGLNVFALFVGFGLGSVEFQVILDVNLNTALVSFGIGGMVAAALAIPLFRNERPVIR